MLAMLWLWVVEEGVSDDFRVRGGAAAAASFHAWLARPGSLLWSAEAGITSLQLVMCTVVVGSEVPPDSHAGADDDASSFDPHSGAAEVDDSSFGPHSVASDDDSSFDSHSDTGADDSSADPHDCAGGVDTSSFNGACGADDDSSIDPHACACGAGDSSFDPHEFSSSAAAVGLSHP